MNKKEVSKKLNMLSNKEDDISEKVEVLNGYEGAVKRISESQDLNSKEVFEVLKKEMELTKPSEEYNQCIQQVLKDHSKILDGELEFKQKKEILDREVEILSIATERENERIDNNKKIRKEALDKDTEKSEFNWALLKNVSLTLISIVVGSVGGFVGGKFLGKK